MSPNCPESKEGAIIVPIKMKKCEVKLERLFEVEVEVEIQIGCGSWYRREN